MAFAIDTRQVCPRRRLVADAEDRRVRSGERLGRDEGRDAVAEGWDQDLLGENPPDAFS